MYKFRYDYVKPKYGKNAKLCYMDTDSFIVPIIFQNLLGYQQKHIAMFKTTMIKIKKQKAQKSVS